MIRTGMVSVTFRKLTPGAIIEQVAEAGLKFIEWGGDVHVKPGETEKAKKVGDHCRNEGIEVASYGSYYRVAGENVENAPFAQVVETAAALGAPNIRVWAGSRGSKDARDSHWSELIDETQRLAEEAREAGLTLSFEYHGGTLNDNVVAARKILERVAMANVFTYWQPEHHQDEEAHTRGLKRIRDSVSHAHVFHWVEGQRRPLEEGDHRWFSYLEILGETERDHAALLEFVQDDNPQNFQTDAATLKDIVKRANRSIKERAHAKAQRTGRKREAEK